MALKLDTVYKGVPVAGAYVTVVVPTLGMDKASMAFSVQTCAMSGSDPLCYARHSAPYDLEGSNPYEQAYDYLKTLPEFEGATDC